MSQDRSFLDYVRNEVFDGIENITSKPMFGGWGFYKDGVFFALIANGALYFKVDDTNRDEFKKRGSRPFSYSIKGKKLTMSYWELPAEIMEDKDELSRWILRSVKANLNKSK